jgi:hypothetical protein
MESGDVAYMTPPFPADPRALGTTLLEGGEDDEDIHAAWYTRTACDMMIESKVVPTIYDSIVI